MKILILALVGICTGGAAAAELKVRVENLRSSDGLVHYILFKNEEGYPNDPSKSVRKGSVKATAAQFELAELEPGNYAMTFVHDENGNGELDTRFGLPKEGFGFSENPRVYFGPPAFSRSSFVLETSKDLRIKMKYM